MYPKCKYRPSLSKEEIGGLEWLQTVLEAIREKGPKHRSFDKAAACAQALNTVHDHCDFMHGEAHVLEIAVERLQEQVEIKLEMVVQPTGQA